MISAKKFRVENKTFSTSTLCFMRLIKTPPTSVRTSCTLEHSLKFPSASPPPRCAKFQPSSYRLPLHSFSLFSALRAVFSNKSTVSAAKKARYTELYFTAVEKNQLPSIPISGDLSAIINFKNTFRPEAHA